MTHGGGGDEGRPCRRCRHYDCMMDRGESLPAGVVGYRDGARYRDDATRARAREEAVRLVDGRLGYSVELAPDRQAHELDYQEEAERILTAWDGAGIGSGGGYDPDPTSCSSASDPVLAETHDARIGDDDLMTTELTTCRLIERSEMTSDGMTGHEEDTCELGNLSAYRPKRRDLLVRRARTSDGWRPWRDQALDQNAGLAWRATVVATGRDLDPDAGREADGFLIVPGVEVAIRALRGDLLGSERIGGVWFDTLSICVDDVVAFDAVPCPPEDYTVDWCVAHGFDVPIDRLRARFVVLGDERDRLMGQCAVQVSELGKVNAERDELLAAIADLAAYAFPNPAAYPRPAEAAAWTRARALLARRAGGPEVAETSESLQEPR